MEFYQHLALSAAGLVQMYLDNETEVDAVADSKHFNAQVLKGRLKKNAMLSEKELDQLIIHFKINRL